MRAQIVTIKYPKEDRHARFATARNALPTCYPDWLAETADGTISHVTLSRLQNGRYRPSESKVPPLDNPQGTIKKSGLSITQNTNDISYTAGRDAWAKPSRKRIPKIIKQIQPGNWAKIEVNHKLVFTSYTEYQMTHIWITNEIEGMFFSVTPAWQLDFKENLW